LLIDVVISWDGNIIRKEAEKRLKYTNLSTEIQRMWNMKSFVMPLTTGATESVTKGIKKVSEQYQESIQYMLHKKKTAVLWT